MKIFIMREKAFVDNITDRYWGYLCEDVKEGISVGVDNIVSKGLFIVGKKVDWVHCLYTCRDIIEAFISLRLFGSFTCSLSFSFISCKDLGPGTCRKFSCSNWSRSTCCCCCWSQSSRQRPPVSTYWALQALQEESVGCLSWSCPPPARQRGFVSKPWWWSPSWCWWCWWEYRAICLWKVAGRELSG